MNKKSTIVNFVWKISYAHVIAYFLAGIFALAIMNYQELFSTDSLSLIMRPTTDPIVALGPALQVLRGILLALAIYPIRKSFFEEKHGYKKLSLIVLVFSLISTIGPTIGSFEGYIYTTVPAMYQILGYPEALLYISLFVGIIFMANKFEHKKITRILPIVLVCLIILMGIMGYILA